MRCVCTFAVISLINYPFVVFSSRGSLDGIELEEHIGGPEPVQGDHNKPALASRDGNAVDTSSITVPPAPEEQEITL